MNNKLIVTKNSLQEFKHHFQEEHIYISIGDILVSETDLYMSTEIESSQSLKQLSGLGLKLENNFGEFSESKHKCAIDYWQSTKSLSAEEIYHTFLTYFQGLNSISLSSIQKQYHFQGKHCEDIFLQADENNQVITLLHNNTCIYHAYFRGHCWIEKINNLSLKQIIKIKKLLLTKKAILQEYSGRYLAKLLKTKLVDDETDLKIIKWEFSSVEEKKQYYRFKISRFQDKDRILIQGQNENDLLVFLVTIYSTNSIDVLVNRIPSNYIYKLLKYKSKQSPINGCAVAIN